MTGPRKLLFVVNDAGFFLSHRLPLAVAARDAGWQVAVATRPDARLAEIAAAGFATHPVPITRFGLRPLAELRALLALWRLYRALRPDLVHIVTLKALASAGPAARLAGVPASVFAVTGSGHLFTERGLRWRLLQAGLRLMLRLIGTPRSRLIVQNPDDLAVLAPGGLLRRRTVLIRGSGVDLARFAASPEPPPPVVVLLASRLIRKKGIEDFVAAARSLRADGIDARFLLVGQPDPGNPESLGEAQLRGWHDEGAVEWLGFRRDMAALTAASHVVCLPSSYGEGVPKSLIEGAACGRPLVATDIPGCREIVADGVNGLLVAPGDPAALTAALRRLIDDAALRRRFGAESRRIAEQGFGLDRVIEETLAIYGEIA